MKLATLAQEIKELYEQGYSPVSISALLNCSLEMVYQWLESQDFVEFSE